MKRCISILVILLNCFIVSHAQFHSEEELSQMSDLFAVDQEMFVADTTLGMYHMPRRIVPASAPFIHTNVLHITSNGAIDDNVLILVNAAIYDSIAAYIMQYAHDIHYAHHAGVDVEICTNSNYLSVKDLILAYEANLTGVVLVGDIDVAYYEVEDDHNKYGYKSWPCDLYYMDLDGLWQDNDSNGIYDNHTGNVQPEIFVGRISAYNMGNLITEVDALRQFFTKDHQFWLGNISFSDQALAYNNKDWQNIPYFSTAIGQIFGTTNTDVCNYVDCTDFSKANYLNRNISGIYGFIQLSAHSTPISHRFDCSTYEYLYSSNVYNMQNDALGYNLFCCSACDWKSGGTTSYIGGSYLFNSPTCLFVVGSTKIGSLLYFNNFYSSLGNNNCVGSALKNWWITVCGSTHSNTEVFWHYGLSILGDPMIALNGSAPCPDTIILDTYDNTNSSNLQIYRASSSIQVGDNYQIPNGKKVILDAPIVVLNSLFKCSEGAALEIKNIGCSN